MQLYKKRAIIGIIIIIIGLIISKTIDLYSKILDISNYLEWIHIALLLIIGIIVIQLISNTIKRRTIKAKSETKVLGDLFQVIAYTILAIMLLNALHVNVTGILVGAGFLGIVVGLAAQNTVGNLIAGFELIASKPFSVGEKVTISTWQYGLIGPTYQHDTIIPGFIGTVTKIGIMYTEMLGEDNTPIVIPNNIMNQAVVFNHKRVGTIRVKSHVEIDVKLVDYDIFKDKFINLINADKKIVNSELSVTDINQLSYGIDIEADANVEDVKEIKEKLSAYALKAILTIAKPIPPTPPVAASPATPSATTSITKTTSVKKSKATKRKKQSK